MNKNITSFLLLLIPTAACWFFSGLLFGYGEPLLKLAVVGIGYLLAWVILLNGKKIGRLVWIYACFFLIGLLFLPSSWLTKIPSRNVQPFDSNISVTLMLTISAALFVGGMLLNDGISQFMKGGHQKTAVFPLVLCLLLFAKTVHSLYWFMIWDSTTDSLDYIWLGIPIIAVLFTTLTLLIFLPPKTKLVGMAYFLLIPVMLVGISALAKQGDFRQMTEERAGKVSQAIERFYERNGRYPMDLDELTPWTMVAIPEPLILYGEKWCYESGEVFYSLGYVTRDHWSDPRLYGRVYQSKGEVPNSPQLCDQQINTIRSRNPNYYTFER